MGLQGGSLLETGMGIKYADLYHIWLLFRWDEVRASYLECGHWIQCGDHWWCPWQCTQQPPFLDNCWKPVSMHILKAAWWSLQGVMAGALEDCIGSFLTASAQLYGPCWLAPVKRTYWPCLPMAVLSFAIVSGIHLGFTKFTQLHVVMS